MKKYLVLVLLFFTFAIYSQTRSAPKSNDVTTVTGTDTTIIITDGENAPKEKTRKVKEPKVKKEKAPKVKKEKKTKDIVTEDGEVVGKEVVEESIVNKDNEIVDAVTGFPVISKRPFLMYNEGFSFAFVNRIQKQEARSYFWWQDYMVGAFFALETGNLPCNIYAKISAFYPFFHTFNGMKQVPKQVVLYAFDVFASPIWKIDLWHYVQIDLGLGLHYMYQLSDEFHLNYLGVGQMLNIELPIARRWTILLNCVGTLDYPNFGTNKYIQPYDYAWQLHAELGVRYSKRNPHKYSYIHSRKEAAMIKAQKNMTATEIDANKEEVKEKTE